MKNKKYDIGVSDVKRKNPTANITVGKNRQKTYCGGGACDPLSEEKDCELYLANESEFEIELFNPLDERIMAKVKINGKYISNNGIIVRPGERFYLERFINTPKKFKFTTYEVNGNDAEALKAIENNGKVSVEFYAEYSEEFLQQWNRDTINYEPIVKTLTWIGDNNYPDTAQPYPWYTYTVDCNNISNSVTCNYTNTNNYLSTATLTSSALDSVNKQSIKRTASKNLETGRVENGNNSYQKFGTTTFNEKPIPFYTYNFHILPISQKPLYGKDLMEKRFCPYCGKKIDKNKFKFCPYCGEKL
jgi:hypothetical protein